MSKTLVVVSGGMDSSVLAHLMHAQSDVIHMVSFNYGQRHKKELDYAYLQAVDLGIQYHDIVDLSNLGSLLTGSSLTSDIDVPEGHYAAANMAATVVPNRNAIMLAAAFGVAVARNLDVVATGVHAGDHPIYPDCRPEFIAALNVMQQLAIDGYGKVTLLAPFVHFSKANICSLGDKLGVNWTHTWSCYKGEEIHCGRCGTCVERKEAFRLARVYDPTTYSDPDFEIQAYRG